MIPVKGQIICVDPDVREEIEITGVMCAHGRLPLKGPLEVEYVSSEYDKHLQIDFFLVVLPTEPVTASNGHTYKASGGWEITTNGFWLPTRNVVQRPLFLDVNSATYCVCGGKATNGSLFSIPRWICDDCNKDKAPGYIP